MAANSLQKLEDQISCSVCLDRYTDPKLLQCHHVYCKTCLEALQRRASNPAVITCPTCRKETPVPEEGGVSALEAAFYINGLMELRDSLHSSIGVASSMGSVGSSLSSIATSGAESSLDMRWDSSLGQDTDKPRPPPKPMCPLHDRNELQLYCETCNEVICFQCTIRQHNGHAYELVKDVAEKHKITILQLLGAVKGLAMQIEKAVATVDARSEEVTDLRTSIEGDVHTVFRDLHEMLCVRETELVNQLDKITARKQKSLAGERDCKETILAQTSSCAQQVQETMDTKTDTEILVLKNDLMQRLQQVISLSKDEQNLFKVSTEADMVFSVPPDFATQCKGFGHILTPESIDPQKCIAKGHGLEAACVDKRAVVFMKLHDFKGNQFLKPPPDLECRVVYVRTGGATKCDVLHETENVFEISYTPVERGAHEVHIKIDDMHVRGSPFPVVVRSPVEKLGDTVMVFDDMIQPWAVAVNTRDQVIISECNGHKVTVFGQNGEKIRSIGSPAGKGGKPLKWPRGVALDSNGNIFVADSGNHRVQKFSEQGQLLASRGTVGSGREQFRDPKGLAYNVTNNKVYVADVHRVQIMNSDLTFAGSFGRQGSGDGQFSSAFSVACDSRGYVYVGDKDNRNIQVFTAEGQFLRTFLSRGNSVKGIGRLWGGGAGGKAELAPVGITVDSCGLVYVSDNIAHRVSVFSPEGVCVTTFGREGFASGDFKCPRGLATTEGGVVYVCDFENDRVQVF